MVETNSHSPATQLERETQLLLQTLNDKRDEIQQGAQIRKLQEMQQDLHTAARSLKGVIADDDPLWIQVHRNREEIERQLEDLAISAPLSAVNFAISSSSKDEGDFDFPSFADVPSGASVTQNFDASDLVVVLPEPSVSLFKLDRLAIQAVIVVSVTLFITFVIGAFRLGQTHRLGPSGPFISQPVTVDSR